ncbi:MAG: cytochrome c, partial [Polaromonas sp.]
MKAFASIAAAATLIAMAAPASAQFAKPEDAIKYRQ